MSERKVIVFRVDPKDWIKEEIKAGRLRQGWGFGQTQLMENGQEVPEDIWVKRYIESEKIKFPDTNNDSSGARTRYRILSRILNINSGDLVVIPKVPDLKTFIIAKVTGNYYFDMDSTQNDYGHIIPIDKDNLKEVPYYSVSEARAIVRRFTAYQSAVNNVWTHEFINAAESLYKMDHIPGEDSISPIFSQIKRPMMDEIANKIHGFSPGDMENLVKSAFEEAGYQFIRMHIYDKEGGDADLELTLQVPLLGDFKVFVQVKHKKGADPDDVKGIEQLVKISSGYPNAIKVLISTADELSDECQNKAEENGIILISGNEVAEMLIKYA